MTRRPALRRKQPPYGIRPERVDRQPVQRIGWHRDDGAVEDPVRGFADGVTLRRLRIDEDAAHLYGLSSTGAGAPPGVPTAAAAVGAPPPARTDADTSPRIYMSSARCGRRRCRPR